MEKEEIIFGEIRLINNKLNTITNELDIIKDALISHDKRNAQLMYDLSATRNVKIKEKEIKAMNIIRADLENKELRRVDTVKKMVEAKLCSPATAYRLYNRETREIKVKKPIDKIEKTKEVSP